MNEANASAPTMLSEEELEQLAQGLAKEIEQSTRHLLAHAPSPSPNLQAALEREVTAFALCLAELKLHGKHLALPRLLAEALSRHGTPARPEATAFTRHLEAPPPGPLPGETSTVPAEAAAANCFRLDEEVYLEFCRTTGMDARILVGTGANQASLVFYLVLFGLMGADDKMERQEKHGLLREAALSRQRLEAMLTQQTEALPTAKRQPMSPQFPANRTAPALE